MGSTLPAGWCDGLVIVLLPRSLLPYVSMVVLIIHIFPMP